MEVQIERRSVNYAVLVCHKRQRPQRFCWGLLRSRRFGCEKAKPPRVESDQGGLLRVVSINGVLARTLHMKELDLPIMLACCSVRPLNAPKTTAQKL
jgi:hypothetical protein